MLGVGNPDRGDDGAGRAVAQALRGALPRAIEVAEADGEATDILARLDGASAAFLIDACASGAPAGTVHRFDVSDAPLPQGTFGVSTHGFGLHEAIELARALGQLPSHCVVYAIEGASFETGAPQSPSVAGAVIEVASRLSAEIGGEDREEQAYA
ncbi:MAG: hydrogenase maturation protease [Devosia sp.]|nr:hydrogenase maturation protease [Devosia sp.]